MTAGREQRDERELRARKVEGVESVLSSGPRISHVRRIHNYESLGADKLPHLGRFRAFPVVSLIKHYLTAVSGVMSRERVGTIPLTTMLGYL
jgi:hypothetical protein